MQRWARAAPSKCYSPLMDRSSVAVESRDSPLGRWTVARWSPESSTPLFGFVERIWYFDGAMTHPKERVFPDGVAELVLMLDEPHRDGDSAALTRFPSICINGLRTRPSVVVAPPGRCRVLGIGFTPLGASKFLRSTMKELVDVTVDLRDAIGNASNELGERCATAAALSTWNAARNAVAIVHTAAEWTTRRAGGRTQDAALQYALRAIRETQGTISLDRLGSALNLSRSQFAQRFRDGTGLTPKRFARIVRFHNALSLLAKNAEIASVAAELGYYDQSHMYRDFEEFGRITPREFQPANRYPGSASLAEP